MSRHPEVIALLKAAVNFLQTPFAVDTGGLWRLGERRGVCSASVLYDSRLPNTSASVSGAAIGGNLTPGFNTVRPGVGEPHSHSADLKVRRVKP